MARQPDTSGLPQESTVGAILFNVFINGLDDRTECTFSLHEDDTKEGGGVVLPQRAPYQ